MDAVDLEHFETHGWVRLRAAFSPHAAAAMRDATWRALANDGILRDDPSTWTAHRPTHLQHLKKDPVFQAVGSDQTLEAINVLLAGQEWPKPRDWGAFFLVFPNGGRWGVPHEQWHLDTQYASPLSPPKGLKVHAMFGDVAPRSGAMNILSGSHRLVHRWFSQHPPHDGAHSAQLRKELLHGVPYLCDLCTGADIDGRVERFHDRVEVVDGIPLQVIENTADAGDVIIMHALLLHAPPLGHPGTAPRFLLNRDIAL